MYIFGRYSFYIVNDCYISTSCTCSLFLFVLLYYTPRALFLSLPSNKMYCVYHHTWNWMMCKELNSQLIKIRAKIIHSF
jgi:hypothetical protein